MNASFDSVTLHHSSIYAPEAGPASLQTIFDTVVRPLTYSEPMFLKGSWTLEARKVASFAGQIPSAHLLLSSRPVNELILCALDLNEVHFKNLVG